MCSFLKKKDIEDGELDPFDVSSVIETWLAPTIETNSFYFQNLMFSFP